MAASAKPKILRTDTEVRIGAGDLAYLGEFAEVVTPEAWDEETLARGAVDAELIVTSFFPTISAKIIESARKLTAIVKYGVGIDNIDLAAANARGVMVVNCPEYGSDTVADHAFALLICLARRIIQIDRATKAEAWVWPAPEYCGSRKQYPGSAPFAASSKNWSMAWKWSLRDASCSCVIVSRVSEKCCRSSVSESSGLSPSGSLGLLA